MYLLVQRLVSRHPAYPLFLSHNFFISLHFHYGSDTSIKYGGTYHLMFFGAFGHFNYKTLRL
jgi:hypothetical protein